MRSQDTSMVPRIVALAHAALAPGPPPGWGTLQELPLMAEPLCTAINLFRMLRLRASARPCQQVSQHYCLEQHHSQHCWTASNVPVYVSGAHNMNLGPMRS